MSRNPALGEGKEKPL